MKNVALMGALAVIAVVMLMTAPVPAADVAFKWDASPGATGYKLYKSEDMGATWSAPVDVGNVTTYTWLNVIETKLVLFRASAYNASSESLRSWSGAWFDQRLKPISPPGSAGIQ